MYNFKYKKPTNIYSSHFWLNLAKCNHKDKHEEGMSGKNKRPGPKSNKDRSKVPPDLIKDILQQIIKEVQ